MSGRKFDDNKLRFDLIPPECEESLVRVLTHGAHKYGANDWQEVEPFKDRYYAALRRHLNAWRQGEVIDPDTGLYHSAQIMCNAMFLLWRDIHDNEYVRSDANRTDSSNYGPPRVTVARMSNDDEARSNRERAVRLLTGIFDHLETHKCIGAYCINRMGDGSLEIIFSANNETSAYVAYFE